MRIRLLAIPLLLVLAAAPVRADDDADTAMAKNRVASFDQYGPKAKDPGKYADLVMELASLSHPITVERVGRIVLKDKDEEHQLIAASALAEFKKPDAVRDLAGKTLVKAIDAGPSIDVVDTCVASIGKIGYREAVPMLVEILRKGGDPWLLVTTVRVCGDLKDWRALPQLLELWERFPVGDSWEGGSVTVDTGASGDADQQAAEAAYKQQYGNQKRRGKPPMMLRAYIQELSKSAKKITGSEDIRHPKDLRAWMEARADEFKKLGIEIPKKRGTPKDPDKDGKGKDGKSGKGDKGEKGEKGEDDKDGDKPEGGKK